MRKNANENRKLVAFLGMSEIIGSISVWLIWLRQNEYIHGIEMMKKKIIRIDFHFRLNIPFRKLTKKINFALISRKWALRNLLHLWLLTKAVSFSAHLARASRCKVDSQNLTTADLCVTALFIRANNKSVIVPCVIHLVFYLSLVEAETDLAAKKWFFLCLLSVG